MMRKPFLERLLDGVFRISRYHAWWVVLLSLGLVGVSIYYVGDVPIRSSFLDLLPGNDPLIDEYRRNEEYLGQNDYVAFLLRLTDDAQARDPEISRALEELSTLDGSHDVLADELWEAIYERRGELLLNAAEAVAASMREEEEFIEVSYLVDRSANIPDQYLLLFRLDDERLQQIEESLALAQSSAAAGALADLPEDAEDLAGIYRGIHDLLSETLEDALGPGGEGLTPETLQAVRGGLSTVTGLNATVLSALANLHTLPDVTAAALSLTEIFAPSDEGPREPEPVISADRTRLLLTVRPRYPNQRGIEYSALVAEAARSRLDALDLDALGITVGITGTYAFAEATNRIVNGDMLRTTIVSSIGVLLIFLVAFRSLFYSIVVTIPLLTSVVLTVAWAKFAMNGFNLVTTFLPALVLGLGIDYAIHIVSRYSEERVQGISLNRALRIAIQQKGRASLYAAMTTSLVFLGLLTARSRALFEMGAITSVGILLAFLATLFLLPALITLYHFLFHRRQRESIATLAPRLVSSFRFVTGKGRAILVVVLVLTFFVVFQAAQTSFVFSSTDLVPREESAEVLDEILEVFGQGEATFGAGFTFYAGTEDDLTRISTALEGHPLVRDVKSVWDQLPVNLGEQQRVLEETDLSGYIGRLEVLDASLAGRARAIDEIDQLLSDFALVQYFALLNAQVAIANASDHIQAQLIEVRRQLRGLEIAPARVAIGDLRRAMERLDANLTAIADLPDLATLVRDILAGLPEGLRAQYITNDGQFIINAGVGPDIYDGDNLRRFDEFAATLGADYFGMPLVAQQLEGYMKRDFVISTALAAGLIALTLWGSLGGLLRAALAATPLILGYVWMLGGMRLLDVNFNFLSITISPLLIGIGVDNGIHILHRVREEHAASPDGSIERASSLTAVPVVVTTLTTMLVFGSLLVARTPGLRFLGQSALLGIGFTLLFSLLFLPAALRVVGSRRV
ncbi:MAG: MMPL family transporter [Candidatus Bipolaricaulota bacterium]|nr:MAG: MMPL family transporter [Candidatus Bipolaricaulota bacterium]